MFNSKGTTLKKNMFTFVVYISPVSERSFRIYIQNKRVSTNLKSNLRKKKVLKMVFFIKNRKNRVRCIDNSRILYPTEKYGWGLNDVLSK